MKIVISKFPKSGWWSNGIPKYNDNPAMREGFIPNIEILNKERNNIITVIKNKGHEVIELDFPEELDKDDPKHDFIFIRDPFISNQNGTIIILRSGEPQRRIENRVIKKCLKHLNMEIIEMPNKPGIRADGGEFYFCAKEKILFSGIQRNTIKGANFVAEKMNVNEMIILEGKGYHLDTFFTPVLNTDNKIIALIACTNIMTNESKKTLFQFSDEKNIPVFDIPENDAIGTEIKIGTLAVNALPLPGLLIRPYQFSDPYIDQYLKTMGIEIIITKTSQFQLSGGSVHCITNEL
ncbi:MAG: arginine deiminase-related protein [Candidatus Neomarinimicrobiota bacterium]